MIAAATSIVPATITGPSEFGRMWRTTWRHVEAPSARAASTNSFSRNDRNCARTSRATGIQRKPADHRDDQDEDAELRPDQRLQRVAEQVDEQQQQRQLRQRQEQVGQPHQRSVDAAARDAGERADDRADDDRHQHRREPDRERDASAVEHAREQILAEIVGAERMRSRTGRSSWAAKSMSLIGTRQTSGPTATASSITARITRPTTARRWRRKRRQASRAGETCAPRRAARRRRRAQR